MMLARLFARAAVIAVVACAATGHDVRAQQQPSTAAIAMAKELIELKGATNAFDPLVTGVIEYHKSILLQANPTLTKDLNEVSGKLRAELAPRRAEIQAEIAKSYASHFTEQELKDALVFYKTPLGQKLISAEPKVLDDTTKRMDVWAAKFSEEVLGRLRTEMRSRGHTLL
jgi:hypothetical protein